MRLLHDLLLHPSDSTLIKSLKCDLIIGTRLTARCLLIYPDIWRLPFLQYNYHYFITTKLVLFTKFLSLSFELPTEIEDYGIRILLFYHLCASNLLILAQLTIYKLDGSQKICLSLELGYSVGESFLRSFNFLSNTSQEKKTLLPNCERSCNI